MSLETIPPPAPLASGMADAISSRRRPLALAVACVVVIGLAAWLAWWLGAVIVLAIAAVSWRLRGTRLSPWRAAERSPVPIAIANPVRWSQARNLCWRWEDACVGAGLGRFVDDNYTYEGLTLVGFTERDECVVAHAALGALSADAVVAAEGALAAGLEAAQTRVIGGADGTVALQVVPVATAGTWS